MATSVSVPGLRVPLHEYILLHNEEKSNKKQTFTTGLIACNKFYCVSGLSMSRVSLLAIYLFIELFARHFELHTSTEC